jgi:hypothetical protein
LALAGGCAAPRHAPPPGGSAAGSTATPNPARAAKALDEPATAEAAAASLEGGGAAAQSPPAPVVAGAFARIGEKTLTADDVAREFFRAFRRESFAALNRMVVAEIVRQEAARSGMTPPETWLVRERERSFAELAAQATAAYGKGAEVAKYLETEFKETPAAWARRREAELRDQWLRDRVVRLHGLRHERAEIQLIAVRDETLAREIAAKLDQGADFASLAVAHSTHESAPAGGRLPPVARESLNPALADRAFGLPEGARSGVLSVVDPAGGRQFNILKVVRRHAPRTESYAVLAPEIEASLAREPVSRFEFVAWQLAAFHLYNVAVDDSL